MKLNAVILFAILGVVLGTRVGKYVYMPIAGLDDIEPEEFAEDLKTGNSRIEGVLYELEFDDNGNPVKNTGICNVREWAEGIQHLRQLIPKAAGHKYIATFDTCADDRSLAQEISSTGHCCMDKTAKITYRFKRRCLTYALMRSCEVQLSQQIKDFFVKAYPKIKLPSSEELSEEEHAQQMDAYNDKLYSFASNYIAELKITYYKQCERCNAGDNSDFACMPFGFCGQFSPIIHEEPSKSLCQHKCIPDKETNECRPQHIYSQIAKQLDLEALTDEEMAVVEFDEEFMDMKKRCQNECQLSSDKFFCIVKRSELNV